MAVPSRPAAEQIVRYHKDPQTRIATITLDRPDKLNAPTAAARRRFAHLLKLASIDDEVKVLVIRGAGDHLGSGADLEEQAGMYAEEEAFSPLAEFGLSGEEGVRYPPRGSYRFLATLTHYYASFDAGLRSLQEFKKISIVEAKGYCYGWHFYLAADADLVIASEDALFGHAAWRYAGWAARMWQWALTMGLRKFQEMVFTGRPFTAREMAECQFVNAVVPRDRLEAEVEKYALACATTRNADTVVAQKTFFEVFKQHQGEYLGSILAAWLESMLPLMKPDDGLELGADTFGRGLAASVKAFDERYPPEWRLSLRGRAAASPPPSREALAAALAETRAHLERLEAALAALGDSDG